MRGPKKYQREKKAAADARALTRLRKANRRDDAVAATARRERFRYPGENFGGWRPE